MRIGLPGSSNALGISKRLGLKESILQDALNNLSEGAQKFENIVRSAEESRVKAEVVLRETNRLKAEWQEKIREVELESQRLKKEKEKLFASARAESRRIINERTADAEEILREIEEIFAKESLREADLIKARTLKNRLGDKAYENDEDEFIPKYEDVKPCQIKIGQTVYVKNIGREGVVQNLRQAKGEAEILCGSMKIRSKISDLSVLIPTQTAQTTVKKPKWQTRANDDKVQVKKSISPKPAPSLELNVIGLTVMEAVPEVEAFIDSAVMANLEEVRVVHGVGTGKLRAGIHDFLRTHKNVESYRLGKYGEGETGVTIVKIK
jgi:DNA mismatch repair protein MutS2